MLQPRHLLLTIPEDLTISNISSAFHVCWPLPLMHLHIWNAPSPICSAIVTQLLASLAGPAFRPHHSPYCLLGPDTKFLEWHIWTSLEQVLVRQHRLPMALQIAHSICRLARWFWAYHLRVVASSHDLTGVYKPYNAASKSLLVIVQS